MWKRAIGAFETGQRKARNTAGRSQKDEGTQLCGRFDLSPKTPGSVSDPQVLQQPEEMNRDLLSFCFWWMKNSKRHGLLAGTCSSEAQEPPPVGFQAGGRAPPPWQVTPVLSASAFPALFNTPR